MICRCLIKPKDILKYLSINEWIGNKKMIFFLYDLIAYNIIKLHYFINNFFFIRKAIYENRLLQNTCHTCASHYTQIMRSLKIWIRSLYIDFIWFICNQSVTEWIFHLLIMAFCILHFMQFPTSIIHIVYRL